MVTSAPAASAIRKKELIQAMTCWLTAIPVAHQLACDEDLYRILNESLSGLALGSVGSVGSGDDDEVARPRAIPFMLVSGSSVPRFLR
jgi:hypothetical protein